MAEKLLKETKDAQVKKKRTKKAADEENIEIKDVYKIDFGQEEIDRKKPTKTATTKATRTRSKKNVIKVVELYDSSILVMEANSGVTINKACNFIDDGYDIAYKIYEQAIQKMFWRNYER